MYQLPWDGKDSSGSVVSEKGNYRIELTITPDGQSPITRQGNVTVF
jgi:hypothetical protein